MYSGPAKGKKHALSFIDYSKCEEALKRAMPLSRLVHRTTSSPRVCILFAICRPILKCRMFQKKIHRACVALRMATRLDVNTHESASLIIHRQEAEKGKEKNKYIYAKNLNIIKKVDFVISTKSKELFFLFFKTKDTQEAWFAAVSCPFWLKRFLRRRGQGDEEFPRSRRQSSSSFLARWRGGMYIRSPRHVLFLILFPCHSSTLAFFRFYRVAQCTLSPT